jgi:hypothetical protein
MARWMQALVAAGAIVLVTVPIVFWSADPQSLESAAHALVPGSHDDTPFTITPLIHLMAVAASMPGIGVGLFALLQVWHLFGAYGRGIVFGSEATERLRRLGWALMITAALRPLTQTVLILLLTLYNPPGQRQLLLSVDWQDYLALLFGGLLMAMAWAMAEASQLEQENASFV